MAAKEILFSQSARQAIARGSTSWPTTVRRRWSRGRNVIIEKSWAHPLSPRTALTVPGSRACRQDGQIGAQMVKEVASKTSDVAGDGTTTATRAGPGHLQRRRPPGGRRLEPDGHKARDRCRVAKVVESLKEAVQAHKGKSDIAQVGNHQREWRQHDRRHPGEAMEKVGKEGVVTVEKAKSMETTPMWSRVCSSTRLPLTLLRQPMPSAWKW